jgi:hypothetical protein
MNATKVLAKFDELIAEAKEVGKDRDESVARTGESVVSPVAYYRLFSSTMTLFMYLQAKTYLELVQSVSAQVNPGILQGILESAKREFASGLVSHPRMLLTADSLEGLLEQAEHLLANDYKDAACVLVGGALEGALRSMMENKYPTIQFSPFDGLRKLNDKLFKEAQAYDRATHKLVDGYAEIRNSAAHGDYSAFAKSQVEGFLLFTRNFISSWYAPKITT